MKRRVGINQPHYAITLGSPKIPAPTTVLTTIMTEIPKFTLGAFYF